MKNRVNRIKHYRKLLGLTQTEFAEVFGITKQSYGAKENGKVKFKNNEMMVFKILVNTIDPTATIDDIFFSE